jgi:integrase/recombinase XerD
MCVVRSCSWPSHRAIVEVSTPSLSRIIAAVRLNHETLDTTDKHIHADMELKRRALERTTPPNTKPAATDLLDPSLAFLESL